MPRAKQPLVWRWGGIERRLTKDSAWYHGSPTKFKVGDVLLPPSKTGKHVWDLRDHTVKGKITPERDQVYISPTPEFSIVYATGAYYAKESGRMHKPGPLSLMDHTQAALDLKNCLERKVPLHFIPGSVYRVRPMGPIEPDPNSPSRYFRTPKAVIEEVVIDAVTEKQVAAAWAEMYRMHHYPERMRDAFQTPLMRTLFALRMLASPSSLGELKGLLPAVDQ